MKQKKGYSVVKGIITVVLVILVILLGTGIYLRRAGDTVRVSRKSVIAIDAGHDENYPGYTGAIAENVYAEEVSERLCVLLEAEDSLKPMQVREKGENLPVVKRSEKINEASPEMVLSIHCLYDDDSSKSGARIIVDKPDSKDHKDVLKTAGILQEELAAIGIEAEIGTYYYEPTKPDAYAMVFVPAEDETVYDYETLNLITQCEVPVIQVELLYVSNSEDAAKWTTEEGYQKTAQALCDALRRSYGEKGE